MDGRATDAQRHSVTDPGTAGAGVRPAACRLCGVAVVPGARFCVNCGAIQQRAASSVPSLRVPAGAPFSAALPPLPGAQGAGSGPDATRAGGGAGDNAASTPTPVAVDSEAVVAERTVAPIAGPDAREPGTDGVPEVGVDGPAASDAPGADLSTPPGEEAPIFASAPDAAPPAADAGHTPPVGPGTPARSGRVRPKVTFGRTETESAPAPDDKGKVARGERLVAWLALGVLVVTAGFFVHRIVSGTLQEAAAPPQQAPRPALAGPEAPRPPEAAESAAPSARPSTTAQPSSESPARATAPVPEPAVLKSEEVGMAAAARALKPAAPRTVTAPPAPTPGAPSPPAADVPAPVPVAVAPPPAAETPRQGPAAPVSRWAQMAADLSACASGNFFERVGCEHRVRARYCEGWWGSVAECPSGRQADYGN